jgi:hypothetical protein
VKCERLYFTHHRIASAKTLTPLKRTVPQRQRLQNVGGISHIGRDVQIVIGPEKLVAGQVASGRIEAVQI